MPYIRRVIDDELDELLGGLSAVSVEGPKAVGKTETAMRRSSTIRRLDDPGQAAVAHADPSWVVSGNPPVLIDEWQRVPQVRDAARRAVDADPQPGRFILTGSAVPEAPETHSGAGRIVRVRLRPMSLAEREILEPSASLRELLGGRRPRLEGVSPLGLRNYAEEIVASGFPAIRHLAGRARRAQLDSYITRVVDQDFKEAGHSLRRPETLRRWMKAYAAASATTARLEAIRDAATPGETDKPARTTVTHYRDVLQRLWLLDPVSAWVPSRNYFARLAGAEKHHLADPALAASLLGVGVETLIEGGQGAVSVPRDGTLFGHLFESLVSLSVKVYAEAAEATVMHLRTKEGRHEVDLIVARPDGRVVALEVKLAAVVSDDDVKNLLWLREQMGDDLIDAAVITTGREAYRRADGIGVIPAALLGP